MKYLLDTNVISEALHPKPDANVARWFEGTPDESQYLSVISIAEIRRGAMLLPAGMRRKVICDWLTEGLLPQYSWRILQIDIEVSVKWGDLMAAHPGPRHPLHVMDVFLAAIAIEHGCTLVTRNTKDFAAMKVELLNPWVF